MSGQGPANCLTLNVNCCAQGLAQFDRSGCKQTAKAVINRLLKILLPSKISLSSEHGCVSEQKLDLFNLVAVYVAQLRACSAKIMRSEKIELHSFRTPPNYIPYDVLGDSFTPWRSITANRPKDPAWVDPGRQHPAIDRLSNPKGHWHSPNVTPLPTRSTMTQCPCLICRSSTSRAASSARRNPRPRSTEIIARSRRLRRSSPLNLSKSCRA